MLITFNFSYLENFFVVFYLSFNFFLAPGASAHDQRRWEPRRPSQRREAPPPGTPSRHPHSAQQRLARAHAVGPVLGPHTHSSRARETRVAEPRPPAPKDRLTGGGTVPDTRRPAQQWKAIPPGTAPHHPCGTQPPTGHASQGDSFWAPTPAHPRSQHVGSGPRQPAQRTGSRGRESA